MIKKINKKKRYRARVLHRWLMAIVGLQLVIWSVTGFYMVIFDIDYIHGDTLVNNSPQPIKLNEQSLSLVQLLTHYPNAKNISLAQINNEPTYCFINHKINQCIHANTGLPVDLISKSQAIEIAKQHFNGNGKVLSTVLHQKSGPFELRASALPAWQVNFSGIGEPRLYISQQSGKLVGKRHNYWVLFDWMFRFHIMDYDDGESVDNALLTTVASLSLLGVLLGVFLAIKIVINLRFFKTKLSLR